MDQDQARIIQNKIVNAKKSQKGVIEEVFTLHENLLGKELHPQWTEIVKKSLFYGRVER